MQVAVGTLTGLNSTGSKVFNLPAGFTPKACIVIVGPPTTSGTSVAAAAQSIGFGTYRGGTAQQGYASVLQEDAAATIDAYRNHGVNSIAWLPALSASGGADFVMTLTSMTGGGSPNITFNVSNAAPAAWAATVIAFGGSDLTDALVLNHVWDTTGGVHEVDIDVSAATGGSGWTGKPDTIFALAVNEGAGSRDGATAVGHASIGFGFAKRGEPGRAIVYMSQDGQTDSRSGHSLWTTRLVEGVEPQNSLTLAPTDESVGSLDTSASEADWPTNGFAIEQVANAFAADVLFLVLQGTYAQATGVNTIPTAAPTQNQDLDLGSGTTPKGAIFIHVRTTSIGSWDMTGTEVASWSVGATDGTNERVHAFADDDNQGTSLADSHWRNDKAMASYGQGNPGTVQSTADSSVNGTNIRLAWDDTDGAAYQYQWIIFGDAGSGAQTISPARLDRTRSIFAPTISPGAVTISPARLDRSRSIFGVTVTRGAVTVQLARLDRTRQLFAPSLTVGAVSLTLGRVDRTRQIFTPSVGVAAQAIDLSRLDRTRSIFSPTLTVGSVSIAPARLDRSRSIFSPTLVGVAYITFGRTDRSRLIFSPTLTPGAVQVSLARVDRTRQLFAPTVGAVVPPLTVIQRAYGFRGQDSPKQVVDDA